MNDFIGYLAVLDLDDDELDTYLHYLENSRDIESLPYLHKVLGNDILTFLDLFAGETIKIPSRTELIKVSNYSIIYTYLKERDFSEEAYKKASSLFKRRVPNLKRIVEKVETTLSNQGGN